MSYTLYWAEAHSPGAVLVTRLSCRFDPFPPVAITNVGATLMPFYLFAAHLAAPYHLLVDEHRTNDRAVLAPLAVAPPHQLPAFVCLGTLIASEGAACLPAALLPVLGGSPTPRPVFHPYHSLQCDLTMQMATGPLGWSLHDDGDAPPLLRGEVLPGPALSPFGRNLLGVLMHANAPLFLLFDTPDLVMLAPLPSGAKLLRIFVTQ